MRIAAFSARDAKITEEEIKDDWDVWLLQN
jgi:hypothetical protein